MSVWLFNHLEAQKANPPTQYVPDEACQGCDSDLGDTAYVVRDLILGECCVDIVERCSDCGYARCKCPCPDCGAVRCRCP